MTQWWHRPKTSLGYPLLQLRCKRTVKGIPMAEARDGPGPKLGLPSLACLFSRLAGQVRVQLAELWHEFSCTPSPCPHASYIGFFVTRDRPQMTNMRVCPNKDTSFRRNGVLRRTETQTGIHTDGTPRNNSSHAVPRIYFMYINWYDSRIGISGPYVILWSSALCNNLIKSFF